MALAGLAALGLVLVGSAVAADAHPLGNFTINRYARVEISAGRVRVYYVLDEAEIPAFSERKAVDSNPSSFARRRLREIAGHLRLVIDGHPLGLRVADQSLDTPRGQGGLNTLRVAGIYVASLPTLPAQSEHRLQFADDNEPDRIGWREMVIEARGDAKVTRSSAPERDVSDELRHYPGDLIQAPLDLRSATATFLPGSKAVDALPVPRSAPAPSRTGGAFADLITRQKVNPIALIGILSLAFVFGASHALLPGHGKTVMAAYLVGTKGRPIDAVLLGVIVSIMHTFSVLVLGLLLFQLNHEVRVDQFYPQLTLASGALAIAFGVWLLVTRLRTMRRNDALRRALHEHEHEHEHENHEHELAHARSDTGPAPLIDHPASTIDVEPRSASDHDHGHHHDDHAIAHGHHHGPGGHTHELPEDVAPLSRRGLVVLATSGGIVPSPSAVIVVVAAFSLGRIALGLTLIAAFSVGLAATLTAVGLTLVFGRSAFERRFPNRSLRYLPLAGALALIVAGGVLASQGLTSIT
jgi:nickel/cobalt exporter